MAEGHTKLAFAGSAGYMTSEHTAHTVKTASETTAAQIVHANSPTGRRTCRRACALVTAPMLLRLRGLDVAGAVGARPPCPNAA